MLWWGANKVNHWKSKRKPHHYGAVYLLVGHCLHQSIRKQTRVFRFYVADKIVQREMANILIFLID
jgi:hypothetical protein